MLKRKFDGSEPDFGGVHFDPQVETLFFMFNKALGDKYIPFHNSLAYDHKRILEDMVELLKTRTCKCKCKNKE